MKKIFLIALSALVMAQEGSEPIWYGVIILKDGRQMSTIGDIEVLGDEVRFYDQYKNLRNLPTKVVDVEETNRRNQKLRHELVKKGELPPDDGSHYSQFRRSGGSEEGLQGIEINEETLGYDETDKSQSKDSFLEETLPGEDEILAQFEEKRQLVESKIQESKGLLIVIVILSLGLLFFALAGFITKLYLMATSFAEGLGWAMTLVGFGMLPWALFISTFFIQSIWLNLTYYAFFFLQLILYTVHIFKNCYDRKWKLLFLYLGWIPWTLLYFFTVILLFMGT